MGESFEVFQGQLRVVGWREKVWYGAMDGDEDILSHQAGSVNVEVWNVRP